MVNKRIVFRLLLVLAIISVISFGNLTQELCPDVRAASVTWQSPYYLTTKVAAKKLKKGKKAKVTVTVKNTTGTEMKNITIKATLPAQLSKVKGSLKKTKTSLKKGKTVTYTFYVKAKKTLTFKKKLTSTKKVSGLTTTVTTKNRLTCGKKTKNLTLKLTFSKAAATTPKIDFNITPEAISTDLYMYSMSDPVNFRPYMSGLLKKMNTYAKTYSKYKNSRFAMIANGGYDLYMPNANTQSEMLSAVDGVLIEEAFSDSDTKDMQKALNAAMNNGKKAFAIEYNGGIPSDTKGVVCYSDISPKDDLSTIPPFTNQAYDVSSLKDVKNFMAILNPSKYSKKKDYLAALKATDYDLIFVDLFFHDESKDYPEALTPNEVSSLKKKKNGKTRMVCSYLSVGEAENYRYYWNSDWNNDATKPDWICDENEDWDGNFKVKYWRPEWQKILYGQEECYLDQILYAGFDGVYLDVIDAYEYFEEKQ